MSVTVSNLVIPLTDPRCRDARMAGNKAANLAQLQTLGYNVPRGFCIPTNVAPEDVVPTVRKALRTLPPPWAIRSSSTAEDSKGLAFPGIFATVLGSSSVENAIKAVKKVLASKEGAIIKRYARQHGINYGDIKMAVIIQQLVEADCAGVAFSRNPVTGEDTVCIEATLGLGETLVDGSITPDYFEVAGNGEIKKQRIGTKKEKAAIKNGTLQRVATTEQERASQALPLTVVRSLAGIVRNIEKDFGAPQDVEWATKDGTIYITQSRPITTLMEKE